jgi:hypothetical protein
MSGLAVLKQMVYYLRGSSYHVLLTHSEKLQEGDMIFPSLNCFSLNMLLAHFVVKQKKSSKFNHNKIILITIHKL